MASPTPSETPPVITLRRAQEAVCRTLNAMAHHMPECWRSWLVVECGLVESFDPYPRASVPLDVDAIPDRCGAHGGAHGCARPAGHDGEHSIASGYWAAEAHFTGEPSFRQAPGFVAVAAGWPGAPAMAEALREQMTEREVEIAMTGIEPPFTLRPIPCPKCGVAVLYGAPCRACGVALRWEHVMEAGEVVGVRCTFGDSALRDLALADLGPEDHQGTRRRKGGAA